VPGITWHLPRQPGPLGRGTTQGQGHPALACGVCAYAFQVQGEEGGGLKPKAYGGEGWGGEG
jgi:hypothetical protein